MVKHLNCQTGLHDYNLFHFCNAQFTSKLFLFVCLFAFLYLHASSFSLYLLHVLKIHNMTCAVLSGSIRDENLNDLSVIDPPLRTHSSRGKDMYKL